MVSIAKEEIIKIQRKEYQEISDAVSLNIIESDKITKYREEYLNEFKRYNVSSIGELIDKIQDSSIVYVGDYHTLSSSQDCFLSLVKQDNPKDILLCMEIFSSSDQAKIDRYIKGEKTFDQLSRSINKFNRWDFGLEGYQGILEFAKNNSVKVCGVNVNFSDRKNLLLRDNHESQIISDLSEQNSDKKIYVLHGDYHNAKIHVPGIVKNILASRKIKKSHVIVNQNFEDFYWKLLKKDLEAESVLRLSKDVFCVMNDTPLNKLMSFFHWCSFEEETELEHAQDIAYGLADFFGIDKSFVGDEFSNLKLYGPSDFDFFNKLKLNGFKKIQVDFIRNHCKMVDSRYFPKQNVIRVGNLSLSDLTEELSHWLNFRLSGFSNCENSFDMFYENAIRESIGFLGSKVYCPQRKPASIYFMKKALREQGDNPLFSDELRIFEKIIQHKKFEKKYKEKEQFMRGLLDLYIGNDIRTFQAVSSSLGYMVGEKLYRSIIKDDFSKKQLNDLVMEPFNEPWKGFELYMELNK
jgi:hypothetical protein